MSKRIAIIDGHPDASPDRFIHALARRYAEGAIAAGHSVREIAVAALEFPLLRSRDDWSREAPEAIIAAQETISWAEHIVLLYPLWLGDVPALFKGFLEQVARPGFAFDESSRGFPKKLLKGRSARVIVTMGMPGVVYRFYFGAHSVKSLERNILGFVGIAPVRRTIIGMIEGPAAGPLRALDAVAALGAAAR